MTPLAGHLSLDLDYIALPAMPACNNIRESRKNVHPNAVAIKQNLEHELPYYIRSV